MSCPDNLVNIQFTACYAIASQATLFNFLEYFSIASHGFGDFWNDLTCKISDSTVAAHVVETS
jgi:hypothetical protein